MKFHSFATSDYNLFVLSPETEGAGGSAAETTVETTKETSASDPGAVTATTEAGATGAEKGANETDVEALIAKAVEEATKGLKEKNSELLGKLKKASEEAKKAPQLSDDEYKQFLEIKARMERDELLALMAQGKSEEAIAFATRRTKAEMDAALQAEREEKERIKQEAATARAELENMKISTSITSAAAPVVKQNYLGLVEQLVRDRVKVIDGHTRVVDEQGEVVTKGGKPLPVSELIESLRSTYPDLFHPTAGGGAGGSSTKTTPSGGKLSMDALAELDPIEIIRLRNAGKA